MTTTWRRTRTKWAESMRRSITSQIITGSLEVVEIQSFVRGYHAYKDIWDPVVGQMLLLKRQPDNSEDSHAVAVLNEDVIVGHVPKS